MNTNHYPDLERCKKLTEIGFPQQRWGRLMARAQTPENGRGETWYEPSAMEMLDVIPKFHEDLGWIVIRPMADGWCVGYDEYDIEILGELPNALADLIFWLHENNYIKF